MQVILQHCILGWLIPGNTRSKCFLLSLTGFAWEFQNKILVGYYKTAMILISGLNATDKKPMYKMPLTFVFGIWDFWFWGENFLLWLWVLAFHKLAFCPKIHDFMCQYLVQNITELKCLYCLLISGDVGHGQAIGSLL